MSRGNRTSQAVFGLSQYRPKMLGKVSARLDSWVWLGRYGELFIARNQGWADTDTKYSIPSILAYAVMVSIRAQAVSKRFDTCARCTAHAQSQRFHTVKRKSVMPSGGDSSGNQIFLSIEHVLRHINMFLILNQNLGVVYLSVCMCMYVVCCLHVCPVLMLHFY